MAAVHSTIQFCLFSGGRHDGTGALSSVALATSPRVHGCGRRVHGTGRDDSFRHHKASARMATTTVRNDGASSTRNALTSNLWLDSIKYPNSIPMVAPTVVFHIYTSVFLFYLSIFHVFVFSSRNVSHTRATRHHYTQTGQLLHETTTVHIRIVMTRRHTTGCVLRPWLGV